MRKARRTTTSRAARSPRSDRAEQRSRCLHDVRRSKRPARSRNSARFVACTIRSSPHTATVMLCAQTSSPIPAASCSSRAKSSTITFRSPPEKGSHSVPHVAGAGRANAVGDEFTAGLSRPSTWRFRAVPIDSLDRPKGERSVADACNLASLLVLHDPDEAHSSPTPARQAGAVSGGVVLAAFYEAQAFGVEAECLGSARSNSSTSCLSAGHFDEYQQLGDAAIRS